MNFNNNKNWNVSKRIVLLQTNLLNCYCLNITFSNLIFERDVICRKIRKMEQENGNNDVKR